MNDENWVQIESRVREVIARLAEGRQVPDAEASLTDAGFDSMTKVALIVELEEAFGIRFGEADIDGANFATLRTIVQLIRGYLP